MFLKIINYATIGTIFMSGFVFHDVLPIVDVKLSYFVLIAVLFLFMVLFRNVHVNKNFLIIFIFIMIFSLFNVCRGSNTLLLLSKQVIGIFFHVLVFYLLIKLNKYDIK